MSKRNDGPSDGEAGMTTAERRRFRRRGGALRVPSDNVPRSATPSRSPPSSDPKPAVARTAPHDAARRPSGPPAFAAPTSRPDQSRVIAPDAGPTLVDPASSESGKSPARNEPWRTSPPHSLSGSAAHPSRAGIIDQPPHSLSGSAAHPGRAGIIDQPPHSLSGSAAHPGRAGIIDPPGDGIDSNADFDSKTHEMTAVDLEALGLNDAATTVRIERVASPDAATTQGSAIDAALDVALGSIASESDLQSHPSQSDVTTIKRRAQTVALSDEDLEEVRGARAPSPPFPPPAKPVTKPPPVTTSPPRPSQPPRTVAAEASAAITGATSTPSTGQFASQPIPESISEIDSSAEPTGEYEVEIEDSAPVESETALPANEPAIIAPRAQATPPTPPRPERKTAPTADIAPHSPAGNVAAPSDAAKSVAKDRAGAPEPQNGHAAPTPLSPPPTPGAGRTPPQPPAKKPTSPNASARAEARPTGARVKPWYVDLFDEDYLRTLPFLTPQATQAEAEFVLETMNLSTGAQVLDVGCGYGRHAMELAARGLHVVGLDLSTPLLVRGGEEAQRRGLTINFIRGDMRELDFENQFDAAYCLFSTFGYFEDESNKTTLANIARALKPKGKVLIEVLNRDYLIADLPARVWWEGEGCVVLEEVEFNYFSSRILVNRSVVFDDGRQLEQEISVRAYSLHEVGKLMHAAGFRVLEVSGGYQMRGRFFGNQSRHIIVLGERKES